MKLRIAVDFGTSRTKLAYLDPRSNKPELMRLGLEERPYIPSIVYLPPDGAAPLWGDAAEEMLEDDPAGVILGLKRHLQERTVYANRQKRRPMELLAVLFADLRARAGAQIPAFERYPPEHLVLTKPVLYGPPSEQILREATMQAGFAQVDLVDEPVAAARAWLAESGESVENLIVLDAGGGTLDWAYLRRSGQDFQVVTECPPGGDWRIGGQDVDEALLALAQDQCNGDSWPLNERAALLQQARNAKERYSRGLPLRPLKVHGQRIDWPVQEFEAVIEERYIAQVCEHLRQYLVRVQGVSAGREAPHILLVGGSVRLKGLREAIEHRLDCRTLDWERAEFATVLGAALTTPTVGPLSAPDECEPLHTWFYMAPAYQEALVSRCSQTAALDPEGKVVSGIDGAGLVRDGLALVDLHAGQFMARLDVDALLAAKRFDALGAWDQAIPDASSMPDYLRAFLRMDEASKPLAKQAGGLQLEHYLSFFKKYVDSVALTPSIFNCLIGNTRSSCDYWSAFIREETGHLKVASDYFDLSYSLPNSLPGSVYLKDETWNTLLTLAKCTTRLANDNAHVRQFLESLENIQRIEGVHRWIGLAECWLLCLGDEQHARRCLEAAQANLSEYSEDQEWGECADLWQRLFADEQAARRCLESGEKTAQSVSALTAFAKHWKKLLIDERKVRLCLEQAEHLAGKPEEWLEIATCRQALLGDSSGTQRCLEQAWSDKRSIDIKIKIATAWVKLLGNIDGAEHCLEEAELSLIIFNGLKSLRIFFYDNWLKLAISRLDLLGDRVGANRCLDQAEKFERLSVDHRNCRFWLKIAAFRKERLGDTAGAHRALDEAETLADDWSGSEFDIGVARVKLGDRSGIRRVLGKMEAQGFWLSTAENYQDLLGDSTEARRCLHQAELEAGNSTEYWTRIAKAYLEVLHDPDRARQCLAQAGTQVRSENQAGSWIEVAASWTELFDDLDGARRCLDQAENEAASFSDWWSMAFNWTLLLSDHRSARRCLERAEAIAGETKDWCLCARLWDALKDRPRADFCWARADALEAQRPKE